MLQVYGDCLWDAGGRARPNLGFLKGEVRPLAADGPPDASPGPPAADGTGPGSEDETEAPESAAADAAGTNAAEHDGGGDSDGDEEGGDGGGSRGEMWEEGEEGEDGGGGEEGGGEMTAEEMDALLECSLLQVVLSPPLPSLPRRIPECDAVY